MLIIVHFLVVYWTPLMERRAVSRLRSTSELRLMEAKWTPTRYHALFVRWAEGLGLPIPMTIRAIDPISPITRDADLIAATSLRNLEALGLDGQGITDDGIAHIGAFENLTALSIVNTQISDNGLAHAFPLKKLQFLGVVGNKTTAQALKPFRTRGVWVVSNRSDIPVN
jgi:hypothetical protein